MNKAKIILLVSGIVSVCLLLTGILFVVASETFSTFGGIVIICLSLASGMIMPNPISFFALIAGLCILVFPSKIVGIIFALLGLTGMVTSGIYGVKKSKCIKIL